MKARQGDLAVGLLFVLIVLGAYKALILSRPAPVATAPASTPTARAQPTAASPPPPAAAHEPPRPSPAPGTRGMLFFQDYLKGIIVMHRHGQNLSAAQAGRLLPLLREFTARSRFKLGYYDRFRVARRDLWNALSPAQKRWLERHRAALGHSHAPPEQAAGTAARLLKSLP